MWASVSVVELEGGLLTCMYPCGVVGEFHANGILGLSTGSPSIGRHLWAVRSGYVPSPGITGSGSGVRELLSLLGALDIVVTEPLPPICVRMSAEMESANALMIKTLVVADVLAGMVSRCGFLASGRCYMIWCCAIVL